MLKLNKNMVHVFYFLNTLIISQPPSPKICEVCLGRPLDEHLPEARVCPNSLPCLHMMSFTQNTRFFIPVQGQCQTPRRKQVWLTFWVQKWNWRSHCFQFVEDPQQTNLSSWPEEGPNKENQDSTSGFIIMRGEGGSTGDWSTAVLGRIIFLVVSWHCLILLIPWVI